MWMLVQDGATGANITNATFPWLNFYNEHDGWYYVYNLGPTNSSFSCSAPGYYTLWTSTDSYLRMTLFLQRKPPQPPPVNGGWA